MAIDDGLADFGNYPEVYADGLGAVDIVGGNARLTLFVWVKQSGVYRRSIILKVVRPTTSLDADAALIEMAKRSPAMLSCRPEWLATVQ
jgi:hypothetical protein